MSKSQVSKYQVSKCQVTVFIARLAHRVSSVAILFHWLLRPDPQRGRAERLDSFGHLPGVLGELRPHRRGEVEHLDPLRLQADLGQ